MLPLLEAGEGFGFVVEGGDVVEPLHGVERGAHAPPWLEQFQSSAGTAEADESAGDGADAGTVELSQIAEIQQEMASAARHDFAQAVVEEIIIFANRRFAFEVDDGHASRFASRDIKAHENAPSVRARLWECAGRRDLDGPVYREIEPDVSAMARLRREAHGANSAPAEGFFSLRDRDFAE